MSCLFSTHLSFAQDFSNKGREFWVLFPPHQPNQNNLANLSLYISSDKNSSGKIIINGVETPFAISSNTPKEFILDRASTYISGVESANDTDIASRSKIVSNKGIKVVVDEGKPPVVVYAHLYANARSAATIVLPTAVLERRYIALSYQQAPNNLAGGEYAKSQFSVIAVEANTRIRIQLRKDGELSGDMFEVSLPNIGDIYSFQDDKDLTGTTIESVSENGLQCNKIAVFSGSSAIKIAEEGVSSNLSVDPLWQQCYPINSWGKNYFITPIRGKSKFLARILARSDNTTIRVSDETIVLDAGEFYEFTFQNYNTPIYIQSEKPICVAQFSYTQSLDLGVGDPEMIILNSIEQSINDVTVFLSSKLAIADQNINVIIKNSDTASFKINGIAPNSYFIPIGTTEYAYLQEHFTNVPSGGYLGIRMTSDSGFNAFCYGFGNFESYGYSAGTNVKDFDQYLMVNNEFSIVSEPITCRGTPFNAAVALPYKPNSVRWKVPFYDDFIFDFPLPNDSTIVSPEKTIYQFKLDTSLIFTIDSTYEIRVIVDNPTADGCSGEQEIFFTLKVVSPPKIALDFLPVNCINGLAYVNDTTKIPKDERPIVKYKWDIGDGRFIDSLQAFSFTPLHVGANDIRHFSITDIGCLSDTIQQTMFVDSVPKVGFGISDLKCQYKNIIFSDSSKARGASTIKNWIWDFGDKTAIDTIHSNTNQLHLYQEIKKYFVTLKVSTVNGCVDSLTQSISVHPNPSIAFDLPEICLQDSFAYFIDKTSISDFSNDFKYDWNFGDFANILVSNVDTVANPKHRYLAPGEYNVSLKVTSSEGCVSADTVAFTVNGSIPLSSFEVINDTALCSNQAVRIVNHSSVDIGQIGKLIIFWDYEGNILDTSIIENPSPNDVYTHIYTRTHYPDVMNYKIKMVAYSGGVCADDSITNINILPYPLGYHVLSSKDYVCTNDTLVPVPIIDNIIEPYQYTWTVNDSSKAIFVNNILYGKAPGDVQLMIQLKDAKNCEYTFSNLKEIQVRDIPIAILTPKDTVICNGEPITLNGQGINNSGSISFEWILDNNSFAKSSIGTISTTQKGIYRLIVNDEYCHSNPSIPSNIISLDIPTIHFTHNQYTCKDGNLIINSNAVVQDHVQYLWNFGDSQFSTLPNPGSHSYAINGEYTIELSVTNDYCPKFEYTLVGDRFEVVNPLNPMTFTYFVLADQDTILSPLKVDSGYVQYSWNPKQHLSNPFISTPIYRGNASTQYTLTRTDPLTTCFVNDLYFVNVSDEVAVSIPKAFTPNGDQLNDHLRIQYGAGLKVFNGLKMFNRFGRIVFQTNQLNDAWDGKFNGVDQEMDAYTYLIDYITYKDEHIIKTGSVILLR